MLHCLGYTSNVLEREGEEVEEGGGGGGGVGLGGRTQYMAGIVLTVFV